MGLKKVFLFFLCFVSTSPLTADYIINLPEPLRNSPSGAKVENFFREIYREVEIKPTFISTTVNRGFKSMHEGNIHAEAYRAHLIGDALGEKFKIDYPLAKVKVALFCSNKKLCHINTDYTYAIQRGFSFGLKICEELSINCKFVPNSISLAKLLDKKIVDAVISPYPAYKLYLCKSKSKIFYYQNIPDYSFNIYHFTSLENQQIRSKLTETLKDKIKEQHKLFAPYSSKPNLSECNKQILSIMQTH